MAKMILSSATATDPKQPLTFPTFLPFLQQIILLVHSASTKISQPSTYPKLVAPIFYFGLIALFWALQFASEKLSYLWIGILSFITIVFVQLFVSNVWPAADEVHDLGDRLLVRRGSRSTEVPFGDISSMEYFWSGYPRSVALKLKRDTPIGKKIIFFIPTRFFSIKIPDVVERLDARIG